MDNVTNPNRLPLAKRGNRGRWGSRPELWCYRTKARAASTSSTRWAATRTRCWKPWSSSASLLPRLVRIHSVIFVRPAQRFDPEKVALLHVSRNESPGHFVMECPPLHEAQTLVRCLTGESAGVIDIWRSVPRIRATSRFVVCVLPKRSRHLAGYVTCSASSWANITQPRKNCESVTRWHGTCVARAKVPPR